jgi:hypothetical protein
VAGRDQLRSGSSPRARLIQRATVGALEDQSIPGRGPWTVELARTEARKVLGKLAMGENPNAAPEGKQAPSGPTVRDGVETHLAKMRKRGRAERSIATFVHWRRRDEARRRARLERPSTAPAAVNRYGLAGTAAGTTTAA